jgi:hypothetical protein
VYVSCDDDAAFNVFLFFGSLVSGDIAVAVEIGFSGSYPRTRERVKTDRIPSPATWFPSKEYWVESEAVSTTRPLP